MKKPIITKECLKPLLDTKFLKAADLQYAEGRHYFIAGRKSLDEFTAIKSEEEFRAMHADAATCFVIVRTPDTEPKLLLQYEFRYPTGQFLLSPPAGLIDPEDREGRTPEETLLVTARREIHEETGIEVKDSDRLFVLNPLLFSSPGMTDESNGIVGAVIDLKDFSSLGNDFSEDTECFDGFELVTKDEAQKILKRGTDKNGIFYSVYTWAALLWFLTIYSTIQ